MLSLIALNIRALIRPLACLVGLRLRVGVGLGFALCTLYGLAQAETPSAAMAPLPVYQRECGACHVAYPAGMLPAASWKHLLGGLGQHFGVDASLDAPAQQEIGDWLALHGGTFRHATEMPPHDRITQSRWWLRQHDEVSASNFTRKSVGSASNCAACHPGAARGKFSENDVRIPK